MIQFNIPPYVGEEEENNIRIAIKNKKICGDGEFTKKTTYGSSKKQEPKKPCLQPPALTLKALCQLIKDKPSVRLKPSAIQTFTKQKITQWA